MLGFASAPALGHERVHFPSLDRSGGATVTLVAHWFAAGGPPAAAPALVLLHGCSGPHDRSGSLGRNLLDYATWLSGRGFHALVVDSFSPRGEASICTQRHGLRRITQAQRRGDALAAVQWLASRADVQRERIGLLGWSHGGSTVLASINQRRGEQPTDADRPAISPARPAFAIAFYPGCTGELQHGFSASADLLLLVGDADDWTPAPPCHRLAEVASGRPVEIESYPGAHHGFDSPFPLRHRADVPNGRTPGAGVHVGRDEAAATRSRARLAAFLASH